MIDIPNMREKVFVFANRSDAGKKLAKLLEAYKDSSAIILAVPAGGIPVAVSLAEILNLPVDIAVVSKITFPDNSEAGFGAVAYDGSVRLNTEILGRFYLTEKQVQGQLEKTKQKVQKRVKHLRGDNPMPDLTERTVFLVDDGIASGFTLRTAAVAIKNENAKEIIIATPTGHKSSLKELERKVDAIYCANVRSGWSFAVADAYKNWRDVSETEALEILNHFHQIHAI